MCSNAQQRQYTIRTPNDFAHAFDWQHRKLWRSQWGGATIDVQSYLEYALQVQVDEREAYLLKPWRGS